MTYDNFLKILAPYCEEVFARFQNKLILPPKQKILGVRTPTLRKIAKKHLNEIDEIFSFPNEYYEISFIKLTMASLLPYQDFLKYLDECVKLIDNWALCDSFKANCIKNHKKGFLPIIEKYFITKKEFCQRYALVCLLSYYMEEEYFEILLSYLQRADTSYYYVHMASAWLTAEIIIKHYEFGLQILHSHILDVKTHNKSIQKARESFRLNADKKAFLNTLKIKN